ncbi:HET-domain-containing protein [Phaeosphaeriaceae sp. SRC1lsM3a]|nr:HET-domain-containing protein [Stagonospora sp. SRC1lsM3a]
MSEVFQFNQSSGSVCSVDGEQDVIDDEDTSGYTCSFIADDDTFDEIVAKSKPDCKHCTARKEAIVRLLPDVATRLSSLAEIRWWFHDINDKAEVMGVFLVGGKSAHYPVGFYKEIELFFLDDNVHSKPFCLDYQKPNSRLRRLPPLNTSSEASLQFALSCLRTCIEEHADCGDDAERPLPTRVLSVGSEESPTLFLHESRGQHARYACLSHCWGTPTIESPLLQTNTGTIESFRHHIPWADLPKTFQDTVTFVRRLKIRYLWIDSLCIIQNDKEDMAKEIGQMASVYSNALVTIAATSAADPHEGLFDTNGHPWIVEQLSSSAWDPEASEYGPLYAREENSHVWRGARGCPLLKRAWVFQERFLSRRVLHFTKRELMWECMSASGCECLIPLTGSDAKKIKVMVQGGSISKRTRDQKWSWVVETYSSMHLTYNTDILPGLSGLASVYKTRYPDQYLAGLWRSSLVTGLLWTRFKPGRKPLEYQAPSWSWASYPLGTHIQTADVDGVRELAHISAVCCIPTYDTDPTGMVSSGYIRLTAKAAPGKLRLGRKWSRDHYICDFRGNSEYVSLDCLPESEELDVFVVAIVVAGESNVDVADRDIHFLVLSSNVHNPETFRRRGRCSYEGWRRRTQSLGGDEGPSERWTPDEIEWWTSDSADGRNEFTIV